MTPLLARATGWLASLTNDDHSVADAAIMGNLRRLRWLALVILSLNLLHVALFWLLSAGDTPAQRDWRNAIGWTHLVMAAWMLLVWLAARTLSLRDAPNSPARVLQVAAPFGFLMFTVAVTVIDQSVTPNISPFLLGTVFVSLLLLMRPALAALLFALAYVVFHAGLGLTQPDAAQLLSNRVNGAMAMVLALVLSIVLWQKNTRYALLHRELESRNAALVKQQDELVWLAKRDALTGLFNRGEFLRIADLEQKRAQRHGTDTSLIMVDLDLFKNINDSYGHPAGDSVLKHTAACLLGGVRNTDVVARVGGEEFVILLPQTGLEAACVLADKLLRLLRQAPARIASDLRIDVTASFGVGSAPGGQPTTVAALYAAADHALYEAKRLGRNRVEKTEPDPSMTPSDFQRMRRK